MSSIRDQRGKRAAELRKRQVFCRGCVDARADGEPASGRAKRRRFRLDREDRARQSVLVVERIVRCGISLDPKLLARFDALIARLGYANRSEAIRDLIRDKLVAEEWEHGKGEAVATVSLVYDHHELDLPARLTDLQHEHHSTVVSALHVHLDDHNCLEVLVLRGAAPRIRTIGEKLTSVKGVKHGKMMLTTTGRQLS